MQHEWVRQVCLSFPGVTEQIQWESDLLFKVGGKMFAVMPLEPSPVCLSFKCTPDDFAELTERPGIIPAPYLARAQWVALEVDDALPPVQLREQLRRAYDQVVARLPKKTRATIGAKRPFLRGARAKRRDGGVAA